MTWVLIAGLSWIVLALGAATLFVRVVRFADQQAAPATWTDEVERYLREESLRDAGSPTA